MMARFEPALRTVLFTDIVGSTERASELGDRGWHELLAEHHSVVRRELRRFGGREANTAGDGFLATFDRPADAIRCAWSIREGVRQLGLELRSGIHTGEVEGQGAALGGIAVHIGARVAALAGPGEVLVSEAVRELVEGAGFRFEDRGRHVLKGVPGEWHLHALKSLPAGPARPRTDRRLPELTTRRIVLTGVVLGSLVIGVVVSRALRGSGGFAPGEAVAETTAGPGVAVLPFTVRGEGLELWGEGVVDLLSTALDGAAGLRGIDSRTIFARWTERVPAGTQPDLATTLDVARRTGARYAVIGSAVAIGPNVRLSADVYEIEDGRRLGQGVIEGAPDSVLMLTDRLAVEVLRILLEASESELPRVELANLTTSSFPALKAYLEGETFFRKAEFQPAIAAYERAVEIDSTFARAFYRLGLAYGWSESINSERQGEAIERAVRLADRLPEREAVFVRATLALIRFTPEGIEPLRAAVRKYPDDAEAWYLLGDTYMHNPGATLAAPEDAERAFMRAAELDPRFAPYQIHLIDLAFSSRDTTLIKERMRNYERVAFGSDSRTVRTSRFAYSLLFGNPAERELARAALDTLAMDHMGYLVNYAQHPLNWPAHEAWVVAIGRRSQVEGAAQRQLTRLFFGRIFDAGRLSQAVELLDDPRMAEGTRVCGPYEAWSAGVPVPQDVLDRTVGSAEVDSTTEWWSLCIGAYAADRADWELHARTVRHVRGMVPVLMAEGDTLEARYVEGLARALEGYALWKRGRAEEALGILQEVHRTWDEELLRFWIAELLIEIDRPREAEPYFRSFWFDPLAHQRLGQMYEQLGEREKALEAYEFFLAAWRGADPELRPLLESARQGAIRMRGLQRG